MTSSKGSEALIFHISGAGYRLSLLLNAAACELAQSRIEIHSIAKGISLFASALKQVGQKISTNLHFSNKAREKACEVARQGQTVFVEIQIMLDKLHNSETDDVLRRIPVFERLKRCFRKQQVTYLLAHLESLKLSLIVMLRVLQLGESVKSHKSVSNDDIAQEKAEAQNMLIIRHWSMRRLDRFWEYAKDEAWDAEHSDISKRINYSYLQTTQTKPSYSTKAFDLVKIRSVTFGSIDMEMHRIERFPQDMVHISESSVNRLLALWVANDDSESPDDKSDDSRARVSADNKNENENSTEYGTVDSQGHENNTTDKPRGTKLRRSFSHQARVESDPESDEKPKKKSRVRFNIALDSGFSASSPNLHQSQSRHAPPRQHLQQSQSNRDRKSRNDTPPILKHNQAVLSSQRDLYKRRGNNDILHHRHRVTTREENNERNNLLIRTATRGLVGIGAIAGFMDALEAFSIL